jgi:predicted small integral membrane protein
MTKQNTLREIEKKAYMSYHQDGLLDIFVGLYALAFGLGMIADKTLEFGFGTIMPAILIAIVLPIWIEAKRKITMPRIGFVKFGTRGSNKLFALLLGLAVAGLGVFFLFTLATFQNGRPEWIDILFQYGMIWIGLGAAVIGSLFAYTMGLKRLHGYGLLSFALFASGYFLSIPFEYLLLVIGSIIIVSGAILLAQFVRRYPLQKGVPDNVAQ